MSTGTLLGIYGLLHMMAIAGLVLGFLNIIDPIAINIFLVVLLVLVLADIVLWVYYLFTKSSAKTSGFGYGARYGQLKMEEGDKYLKKEKIEKSES